MNDVQILENLFNNKHDEISFQNFSESNIIIINNNNKGDYSNQKLIFNTQRVSSKIIDYSNSLNLKQLYHIMLMILLKKDINNFFRKIDLIHFGEFDITLSYKNPFIFARPNSNFTIESSFLFVNEIKLNESDNIKCLKMLDNGYTKKLTSLKIM